ncbi:MAG TPA: hypothetical protein IGS40_15690 [Trichormus sp. M33_DOE_039]|nr:hypothetical protein [Trichormus sp. M33_DOE_039]
MTSIRINDIEEVSCLNELTDSEADSTRGGIVQAILLFYAGYEIGKEIAEQINKRT